MRAYTRKATAAGMYELDHASGVVYKKINAADDWRKTSLTPEQFKKLKEI